MKLDVSVKTLGPVNYQPLKEAVNAIHAEAWAEDTMRQNAFAEQHKHTQSIIMLFGYGWPQLQVDKRQGWTYFSQPATALWDEIIRAYYPPGGRVIRAMVAKLLAGGSIARHTDSHPSFAVAHRIHVPLVTNDKVDFVVREETHHLTEGVAYEISNLDFHSVANRSPQDRIHFIFDYAETA